MENMRILIVDDERSIVEMLEKMLMKEGFTSVMKAYSAEEALTKIHAYTFDFIVLDVMLPDGNGFDLGPKIREKSSAHILYLTAKTSDFDVLTGFAVGGDDYVTKPFNPLEIVARLKAVQRRMPASRIEDKPFTSTHDFGHFKVNEISKELIVRDQTVSCPALVYRLLLFLCKHPNQVFTKSELFDAVWGMDHIVDDNTIMVHIRRIRERIEPDPSRPQFLITIRGLGYKLVKAARE
ncbi:response regulator transcription factor [Halobacillus litoralis]|uniref:response regulator transcription factor n=1 Tax=Halobacillus litoralis TaxID=45668 RepID=UPI001CD701E0|nr:response regulator transcription factor [Halobacillus litoralis]MCA0970686.1 response regulator transcription factor [Halobacillus litoralis]